MGEDFISKRAGKFRTQQDAAYQLELIERTLFSERTDLDASDYPCVPSDEHSPIQIGEVLVVRDARAATIPVLRGNCVVGHIDGSAVAHIRGLIESDSRCAGMLTVKVHNLSPVSGRFVVRSEEKVRDDRGQPK